MATAEQIQDEIDRNYTAFKALLPDLMKTSRGKWALLPHISPHFKLQITANTSR